MKITRTTPPTLAAALLLFGFHRSSTDPNEMHYAQHRLLLVNSLPYLCLRILRLVLLGAGYFWAPNLSLAIGPIQVSSITALKSINVIGLTDGYQIPVSGYYAPNDGGGGVYVYNSTNTAADNGGTVIQPIGVLTGRWLLQDFGVVSVAQFGATTNSADNSAVIYTAFEWLSGTTQDSLFFPKLYTIKSGVTLPHRKNNTNIKIWGTGQSGIRWGGFNSSATIFTLVQQYEPIVSDFQVVAYEPAAIGIYIERDASDSGLPSTQGHFTNVVVDGRNGSIKKCVVIGGYNGNNDFHYFDNCTFQNYALCGLSIESQESFNIILQNCRIANGEYGVMTNQNASFGGGFIIRGGAIGGNSVSDFDIGSIQGPAYLIDGINSEQSNRFVVVDGPDYENILLRIVNCRWSDKKLNADGQAIIVNSTGAVEIDNSSIGDAITTNKLYITMGLNSGPGLRNPCTLTLQDTTIGSAASDPFSKGIPATTKDCIQVTKSVYTQIPDTVVKATAFNVAAGAYFTTAVPNSGLNLTFLANGTGNENGITFFGGSTIENMDYGYFAYNGQEDFRIGTAVTGSGTARSISFQPGSAISLELFTDQSAIFRGKYTSSSPTAGFGYSSGAGATVTQLASKSTSVTLNTVTGQITMNAAALSGVVTFVLTDSSIKAADTVVVSQVHAANTTAGAYLFSVSDVQTGSCEVTVANVSGRSLSEAIVLNFSIVRGSTT